MENIELGSDAEAITSQTLTGLGETSVTSSFDVVDPVCTSNAFTVEDGYFGYAPSNSLPKTN